MHVYHSNGNKLRTAGLFLRESDTQVQLMQLGYPETYAHLSQSEQSLRLRIYWLVLITERTYSAQHGLQAVLQVIDVFPDAQVRTWPTSAASKPLNWYHTKRHYGLDSHDHAAREAQWV
ncbi:hypothetical protein FSHL1_006706, partial [Fusarium sambucinum]